MTKASRQGAIETSLLTTFDLDCEPRYQASSTLCFYYSFQPCTYSCREYSEASGLNIFKC